MKDNDIGDHAAMRQALVEAGYGSVNLMQCLSRGKGPPVYRQGSFRKGDPTLFRWSDVRAWAANRPKTRGRGVAIDLKRTALGRWMAKNEVSANALADRLCMTPERIYRLIGHRHRHWHNRLPQQDILQLVSLETGIGIGELVEDAIACGE
jgi:hypothetical protein